MTLPNRYRWLGYLLLAIFISSSITYLLVTSGVDWKLAVYFNQHQVWTFASIPIVLLGMIIPPVIPVYFYCRYKRSPVYERLLQFKRSLWAFITSYLMITFLKVITNRVVMDPFDPIGNIDTSAMFRFGWMKSDYLFESLIEGWPSGHTTIAFAMAIAIYPLLTKTIYKQLNLAYATLVALCMCTGYHWLSDVISGIIIGITTGLYFAVHEFRFREQST